MKKGLLLIIVLFSSLQVYSQSISVNLSTHWSKGENPLSSNDSICIPYLDITYCNNSDKALYLMKVAQQRNGFFIIPLSPNTSKRKVTPGKLIRYDDYSQDNYKIKLSSSPFNVNALEVIPDTIDYHEEHEVSYINDDLFYIHDYLSGKKETQVNNEKLGYQSSDVTPEKILNEFSDKFVFLNPGETYVDTFNLIAFKLVKGTFTFYVDPDLKAYVYGSAVWDKNQLRYTYEEIALPLEVGDYKLYADSIVANKATITF